MFDKLEDKMDFEFKYMCGLYALIRIEECISRSFEIAAKMAIYKKIMEELEKDNIPKLMQDKMLQKSNLIDYLYLNGNSNNIIVINYDGLSDNTWKRLLRYTDL